MIGLASHVWFGRLVRYDWFDMFGLVGFFGRFGMVGQAWFGRLG